MLGKLIKHDFKSLTRVLFPAQLAILGATVIFTLGIAFNMNNSINMAIQSGGMGLLRILMGLLSGIMALAIIAALLLVTFIIFQRFYKSFMSDEGYLTFTLPVTTSQLLWSKLITAMIWTIISSVVIFICFNIFILFGTESHGVLNIEAYSELSRMIHEAFSTFGGRLIWPIIEFVLLMIVGTAFGILHVYLALIIGGVVAQKHKLLAGIGFYFAINIAVSIISTIAQYIMGESMVNTMEGFDGMVWGPNEAVEAFNFIVSAAQPYYWFYLVFTLAITATFFLLCRYFLKNKLNLE